MAGIRFGVAAVSIGLVGCPAGNDTGPAQAEQARASLTAGSTQALQSAFPSGRTYAVAGGVSRISGASLSTGATPADASAGFERAYLNAMGLSPGDLVAQEIRQGQAVTLASPQGIGLMYDEPTGQPKFWLYRSGQTRNGVKVHRAELLTLVRNAANNPVVWASSSLRALPGFAATVGMQARAPDRDKSLRAIRGTTDFTGKPVPAPQSIASLSSPELVVFAGTEDHEVAPRMAIEYTAQTAPTGKWHFVADANTGDVLSVESLVVFADITGNVAGNVTQGDVAMECAPEPATAFPFAKVDGPSGETAFTGADGAYLLVNSVDGTVNIVSAMSGEYFTVTNLAGAVESLTDAVTPPVTTADFLHNAADTDAQLIAQANGFVQANQVRGFLLKYLPTYPTISTQTGFPVHVNLNASQSGYTCPGNAYYDGVSLNLCLGDSVDYTNTSFASVTHHEYGHHIISCGGSGQGEYGEGMADCVAALYAGQSGLGFGFFLNQCTTALRNANNTCQYSATMCSSCGSEIHSCGMLLSGTIWDIRKNLAVTNPDTYVDLINKLTLSSIPLHKGTGINSQIAIDLLTLDDNDGNIANGTPHYNEICSGFTAHGMTCPPILNGLSVSPKDTLSSEGPVGGPFAPANVIYTVSNLGPTASIQYQVSAQPAATWLSITNGSGQLTIGQTAQVTVAIDQAVAGALAKGGFDTVVQFTNLTDGVGNTTRAAHLQVGVPTPIYTETFEGGLGSFTLGSETTNLWHVSSGCASSQPGHSLPNSLYFGIDSSCTFSNGLTVAGTATSGPITISDTSAVKLRFKYFLVTEHGTYYDKASAQVSVNGGAFTVVASNNAGGVALTDGGTSWLPAEVDLAPLLTGLSSPTVRVRFAFDSIDSIYNAYAGFLADDVQILAFSGAPVNQAPVVSAGPDLAVTLPAAAILAGTVTDDGLPNPPKAVTTTWSMVSGPGTVTFADPSAAATTATFSQAGPYVLRLTGNDSALSASDDVAVTVNPVPPVNQAPVVNAGPDLTVTLPAAATLAGTVTDDGLPNPPKAVTTTWSMVSGPGTVTFADPSAAATTATFSQAGPYVLRLTGNDSALSASDDVAVTVNPAPPPVNQAPVVNAGPDLTVTLPAAATLAGTVTDDGLPNPPKAVTITWSMVSGPGTVTFADPSAAATTATFSQAGPYVLRLTGNDSALSASDDVAVTVNPAPPPVNQAPVVNAGPDLTVTLPAAATLAGTVTDDGLPNPPKAVTITWSMVSGPGTVTFANAKVASTTATFSTSGSYVLRLTGNDSALSASDDVAVTVKPVPTNQAPVVNAGPDLTVTLPAAATLAGTVTDDGLPNPPKAVTITWSKVSGPGTVTFANAKVASTTATFSTSGSYVLRLTGNDGALSANDTVTVTVKPAPANTKPVVNAGPDQTITLPATASLVGTASDDGLPKPPGALTTTWSKVSGPGTVTFGNANALSTTATFSVAGAYVLRLTANDGALSATDDIAITVNASGSTPCSGLCTNPTNFTISGSYQSGNLGTGAVCFQTTSTLTGGNCGNFVSPRTLMVNGTTEPCNGGNWASVPAKRNGGYCIQTTSGQYTYAYFTAW